MTAPGDQPAERGDLVRRVGGGWLHLVLGGTLLVPYYLVGFVAGELAGARGAGLWLDAYLLALPLAAVTSVVPVVRPLEAAAARALLRVDVPAGPAPSWHGRFRSGWWYLLHLAAGAPVAAATLAVPPAAALLLASPLAGTAPAPPGGHGRQRWGDQARELGLTAGWAPVVGGALLVALGLVVVLAGGGMRRLAPVLLGPAPAERLAELARTAARQAERNRLARELHDSVGHALSVVALQAGAATRTLDSDPAFTRTALDAIATAARAALTDLDHALGLLRTEDHPASTAGAPGAGDPDGARSTGDGDGAGSGGGAATVPAGVAGARPGLVELDGLVARSRAAGAEVVLEVGGPLAEVPGAVSAEAYRILQEGLTNALRHGRRAGDAGRVPVLLRVAVASGRVVLELGNPVGGDGGRGTAASGGGGRGLVGIGERVAALRGRVRSGVEGGRWLLRVELPW